MRAHESRIQTAGFILTSLLILLARPVSARAIEPYTADSFAKHEAAGNLVALQFNASWCPVCKKQRNALRAVSEDKSFDHITLMAADFDTETALRKAYKVKNQSTIIIFKGKAEISRSEGLTDPADVSGFLRKAK